MSRILFLLFLSLTAGAATRRVPPPERLMEPQSQMLYGEVVDWQATSECSGDCLPGPLLRLRVIQAIRGRITGDVTIDVAMPGEPLGGYDTPAKGDRILVVVRRVATPKAGWACGRLRSCDSFPPSHLLMGDELFRPIRW